MREHPSEMIDMGSLTRTFILLCHRQQLYANNPFHHVSHTTLVPVGFCGLFQEETREEKVFHCVFTFPTALQAQSDPNPNICLITLVLGRQQKKKNEVIDIRQGLQSTQFQVFLGCCSVRIWVSGSCLGWEPDSEALRVGKKRRQTGNWLFHRVKLESRIVYTHGQRSSPGQKSGRKEGKKVRLFLGATCAYFVADAWLPVNRAKKHSETGPRLAEQSRAPRFRRS